MHMHILRVGEENIKCDIEEGLAWQRPKKEGGRDGGGRCKAPTSWSVCAFLGWPQECTTLTSKYEDHSTQSYWLETWSLGRVGVASSEITLMHIDAVFFLCLHGVISPPLCVSS